MFKGSDRLCKVVKLSIQCCGKLLSKRKKFFFEARDQSEITTILHWLG